MRILIFSLTYFPFVGGAEVAVKEIIKRLPVGEYEFDLITLRFDSKLPRVETVGSLTIHRIGFSAASPSMTDLRKSPLHFNKYLYPFLAFFKASSLHGQKRYDAIWSIMANYAGFGALLFKWTHRRVPFLLTLQEGDTEEHILNRVGILKSLYERIFRSADRIQAISHYLADFAKRRGARCPVVVVPNGVDVAHFSTRSDSTGAGNAATAAEGAGNSAAGNPIRKKIARASDDVALITISRLVPKNAVDDILRALPLLPAHVTLAIVGVGPQERYLHSLATELGVSKRVIMVGEIAHDQLPAYLQAADIFIRPSISEGMGNSFIEAMAAGIPVIATPVGGIVDFLFDPTTSPGKKPTGIFCEVKNPGSIAKAVLRLSADKALRTTLVSNAQALVRESYDWQSIALHMHKNVFGKLGNERYTEAQ